MFKKIAQSYAIVLSLTLLAVPVKQLHAQAPIVSGTNPVPTGEDNASNAYMMMIVGALSSV